MGPGQIFFESVDRLVYSIQMRGKTPREFRRIHTMSAPTSLGTALITGASTGIGAVYADRLAKRGYDLILVARNEQRLNAISGRLTSEAGRSIKPLPSDPGDKTGLARVEATLRNDLAI